MGDSIDCQLPAKVAIVHEWFSNKSFGGAEQVVHILDKILTDLIDEPTLFGLVDTLSSKSGNWFSSRNIQTSFVQNLPLGKEYVQRYLPILPFAIEQINLAEFPLIISSNHLVAKGVLTSPDQLHISYVHTPVRYAWDQMSVYLNSSNLTKFGLGPLIRYQLFKLRQWDQLSALRVNHFIANSRFTAQRIKSYWARDADVLHPPVDVSRFSWDKPRDDIYLCLSRLVPNKRVDLVVKAFNKLKLPLYVVGDGPEKSYLKQIAGPNVKILGYMSGFDVEKLMSTCRAFVYAGVEDFGIAPVEAMASGAPVIAFGKGGVLDTVRPLNKGVKDPTGILFPEQSLSSICHAISWFEDSQLWKDFSNESIRLWSNSFSPKFFSRKFEKILRSQWNTHSKEFAFPSASSTKILDINFND